MRSFAGGPTRLWHFSREAKFAFSAYVVFAVLGLATAVLYSFELTGGAGVEGVRTYYGAAPAAAEPTDTGGPAIEVDPADQRLVVGVTYRSLLEASHFHLFTVPVLLLIVSHLFVLAGLGARMTLGALAATWGAALAHLAAPWIVHYGPDSLALLMPASGALMLGGIAALCCVTLFRMWRPPAGAT